MVGTETLTDLPPIRARRILQLAFKCWPFIRPLIKHLLILIASAVLVSLVLFAVFLLGTDLFNNKILVGDKLQPLQAQLLFVDESFVLEDIADNVNERDPLTESQRKTVRTRVMIWGAGLLVVFAPSIGILLYYNIWIWQMINQNLRVAMIAKAEHLSLKYHSQSRVGDAIFRIYQDSATITSLIQEAFVGPAAALYGIVVALAFLCFFDPWIAVAAVLALVPMILLTACATRLLRERALANRVAFSKLTSRVQEIMVALRIVKANKGEERALERFDQDSHRALDAAFTLRMTIAVLQVLVTSIAALVMIGAEFVIVYWVLGERETFLGAAAVTVIGFAVWNLGAFEDARERLGGALFGGTGLVGTWARLQDLFIGLERAFYLLELEADIVDPDEPVRFPTPVESVTWKDIHFAYDPALPVLQGVDLVARSGTITAIVGASGAGKSTLVSLLLRLYDPDRGHVLVNGTDLRTFRVDEIRESAAIALQRNVLFAGTVADNIGYAARSPKRADIEAAARVACADGFIRELANGYDTELGERGGKLSSGQRQRLSLARAIVRNTPILILDEPTAALDAETELAVMRNLRQWGKDKVVFLITHRMATIRDADQVVFLEQGRPVEVGDHDSLVRADGRYRLFADAAAGEPLGV
ncbi:MAG: ABC transporter ATP-binding protein [Gammaproteobacteria bacterium]|nr:ABC transporter ATP-binding protein [Gammaproteobacteria bacterium]MYK44901.1 ABC transporter ATP-binding protein [Gammaproteobacteria bacterium]